MRHQRALRRAGGAAGVDEERGIGRRAWPPASKCARAPLHAASRHGVDAAPRARRRRRSTCASPGSRSRIGARLGSDCGSTNATFAALNRAAGIRAPRGRTGTTAARRPRPSGSTAMCATTVSGRCGRISATLSPRATPQRGQRVRQPVRLLLQVPERERRASRRPRPPSTARSASRSAAQRPQQASRDVEVRRHVPAMRGADLRVRGRQACRAWLRACSTSDAALAHVRHARVCRRAAVLADCSVALENGCVVASSSSGSIGGPDPFGLLLDQPAEADRVDRSSTVDELEALGRLVLDRGHDQRLHRRLAVALAQREEQRAWNVRPLIVVASPSTE